MTAFISPENNNFADKDFDFQSEDGVILKASDYLPTAPRSSDILLLYGHGLGLRPEIFSHKTDKWAELIKHETCALGLRTVTYTARGHGETRNWENIGERDIDQFLWESLSSDMISLIDFMNYPNVILSGNSMGAASAIYATIRAPERISGLILLRPPTAWESRQSRRLFLTKSAEDYRSKHAGNMHYKLFMGAAQSDLPSKVENLDNTYGRIRCPTLILAHHECDAHPVSTATTLATLIPNSKLHVSRNIHAARSQWPLLIKDFLQTLVSGTHLSDKII